MARAGYPSTPGYGRDRRESGRREREDRRRQDPQGRAPPPRPAGLAVQNSARTPASTNSAARSKRAAFTPDTCTTTAGQNASIQGPSGLVKGASTFCYWNTAANDSGQSWLAGFSLAVNSNITFYAQWATTSGLTP